MDADINQAIDALGNDLGNFNLNGAQVAQQALPNGAAWLLNGPVPLLFFIAANLEAPENRLRLLAAILCELLVEMLNQGTLEDVGEAHQMIADMVQQHQLVPANQLLPHLGPNHGGMLWHWTQLAGVLHHWGNLTWLTAHPLNAWAQSVLRTSIWKDLADNFCRFEVNRVFFQERILAFMSEVCSLILIKMENGVLPAHGLAVAALTAARAAYVDMIYFTWHPRFRILLTNPPPEDHPLWLLHPEISAADVVPNVIPAAIMAQAGVAEEEMAGGEEEVAGGEGQEGE